MKGSHRINAVDKAFADTARRIRVGKALSQVDLSNELGVDQSVVSRVEAGTRQLSLGQALNWLQALGLRSDDTARLIKELWEQEGKRPKGFWE